MNSLIHTGQLLAAHKWEEAMSPASEGMKAKTSSTRSIPIGTNSSEEGGGGSAGNTRGRTSSEAVRQTSTKKNSAVK